MTFSTDKYSGLVTIIAVLIAVIYAPGDYDRWDFLLGSIGLTLGIKYLLEISNQDIFLSVLVSTLLSLSIISIVLTFYNQFKIYDFTLFSIFFTLIFIAIILYHRNESHICD